MKKNSILSILQIFITTVVLMSCNSNPEKPKTETKELNNSSERYELNYKVYTLEGCEYIVIGVGNTRWGSHKGNCKNPIHKGPSSAYDRLEIENKDYIAPDEKHFNCVVNEAIIERRDNPPYAYITECGILFYSDVKYKVGDVLKNFKSEKHK
jgi:hypothetical protein